MKSRYVFVLFVGFLTHYVSCRIQIDEFVDVCEARDPNLHDCIVRAANQIMPYLTKGIKELDIQPLDPLVIKRMDVGQDVGPLTLQLTLFDTVQVGLNTLVFESADVDLPSGKIMLNGTIRHYDVKGRYTGKGRILMFPMTGNGKADFTFNNTKIYVHLEMEAVERDDEYYLAVKHFDVSYDYDKVKIGLSSLFSDNKRLSEAVQRLLSQNSKEMLNGIKEPLAENYSRIFTEVLQKFFHYFPINELFANI